MFLVRSLSILPDHSVKSNKYIATSSAGTEKKTVVTVIVIPLDLFKDPKVRVKVLTRHGTRRYHIQYAATGD